MDALVRQARAHRQRAQRGDLPSARDIAWGDQYEELDELLVDSRDRKLVDAIRTIHDERHDEELRVGIVWGAAHMPAVVRALHALGYRPIDSDWMTVFRLDE